MDKKSKKGYILINVLFILMVATVVVTAMQYQQFLVISRADTIFVRKQAHFYALGAEAYVRQVLHRDILKDIEDQQLVDSLTESWAKLKQGFEIEDGSIKIQVIDLQSKFNLNSCYDELGLHRFRKLLSELNLPQDIAESVMDWIDPDINPRLGGAEDNEYLLKNPPYRAANQPFASVSELRLLANINEEVYQKLRLHVAALPHGTEMNVNTVSPILLTAMADNLSFQHAESLLERREIEPFISMEDFLKQDLPNGFKDDGLSTMSHYFVARISINYVDYQLNLESTLLRDSSGTIRVILRDFSQDFEIINKDSG